jgi:hypothetical protein
LDEATLVNEHDAIALDHERLLDSSAAFSRNAGNVCDVAMIQGRKPSSPFKQSGSPYGRQQ